MNHFSLKELSIEEVITVEGGSFWEDAAYVVGYTAHRFSQWVDFQRKTTADWNLAGLK